jgi:hypothetical protein
VLVWWKGFEAARNQEMGVMEPDYKDFLADVNERIYDLMDPFAFGYYAHPDFKGSNSIKDVLPVLVPSLSYKTLGIQNGSVAQIRWMRAATGELSEKEADQVYDDLITYCGQDTLAMVKIFEVLEATVGRRPSKRLIGLYDSNKMTAEEIFEDMKNLDKPKTNK